MREDKCSTFRYHTSQITCLLVWRKKQVIQPVNQHTQGLILCSHQHFVLKSTLLQVSETVTSLHDGLHLHATHKHTFILYAMTSPLSSLSFFCASHGWGAIFFTWLCYRKSQTNQNLDIGYYGEESDTTMPVVLCMLLRTLTDWDLNSMRKKGVTDNL